MLGSKRGNARRQSSPAAKTEFGRDDVAVFVMPRGGAMVDVSVAGQRLNYEPAG